MTRPNPSPNHPNDPSTFYRRALDLTEAWQIESGSFAGVRAASLGSDLVFGFQPNKNTADAGLSNEWAGGLRRNPGPHLAWCLLGLKFQLAFH